MLIVEARLFFLSPEFSCEFLFFSFFLFFGKMNVINILQLTSIHLPHSNGSCQTVLCIGLVSFSLLFFCSGEPVFVIVLLLWQPLSARLPAARICLLALLLAASRKVQCSGRIGNSSSCVLNVQLGSWLQTRQPAARVLT